MELESKRPGVRKRTPRTQVLPRRLAQSGNPPGVGPGDRTGFAFVREPAAARARPRGWTLGYHRADTRSRSPATNASPTIMRLRTRAMSCSATRLSASLPIALSSAFLIFSLAAALWFGPHTLLQSNATSRFEPVPAVVESIAVGERTRSKARTRYDVDIAYRYQVRGQSHLSTT